MACVRAHPLGRSHPDAKGPAPAPRPASPLSVAAEPEGGGRGFYASDLWNIKYLRHFKWHHLTEKIGAHAQEEGWLRPSRSRARWRFERCGASARAYTPRVERHALRVRDARF